MLGEAVCRVAPALHRPACNAANRREQQLPPSVATVASSPLLPRLLTLPPNPTRSSIPTTAGDRVYCKMLAHGAVHGAFAGYTGVTVGLVNTHVGASSFFRALSLRRARGAGPGCKGGSAGCHASRSAVGDGSPALCGQEDVCAHAPLNRPFDAPVHHPCTVQYCYLPIPLIIQAPRKVDPEGELWNR
jgi:hypothetical protein